MKVNGFEVKEGLDLGEENKLLRGKIKSIVESLQEISNSPGEDVDAIQPGIKAALGVIEKECGVTIEEILEPRCNFGSR